MKNTITPYIPPIKRPGEGVPSLLAALIVELPEAVRVGKKEDWITIFEHVVDYLYPDAEVADEDVQPVPESLTEAQAKADHYRTTFDRSFPSLVD